MTPGTNSITCVAFNGGRHTRVSLEHALYQYDYGQVLQFTDIDLPPVFEAHFSNDPLGQSKLQIGTGNYVVIPDSMLRSGAQIYCWLFVHDNEEDGKTTYRVDIPVIHRAARGFERINSQDVNTISQLIASFNSGIERIETVGEEATIYRSSAEVAKGLAESAKDYAEAAASIVTGFTDSFTDGDVGAVLTKTNDSEAEWVLPASDFEGDNTRPVTAALLYAEIQKLNAMIEQIITENNLTYTPEVEETPVVDEP